MITKKPTSFLSNQRSRTALSQVKPPHRLSVSSFGLMEFVLQIFLLITLGLKFKNRLNKDENITRLKVDSSLTSQEHIKLFDASCLNIKRPYVTLISTRPDIITIIYI
ncbi:Hypothetical_protein [Hexamita inflata]|uniref:Hypothetical_protein n=1 Tax=Hexamita inflata TaxID=28002 RepID=A0AA86QBN6_9EUKA|nr:Hypothetical protein HINF_LOCUS43894 [Hexamita inflata]